MQPFFVLLVLFLIAVFVILPIWVIAKISGLDGEFDVLQSRLRAHEDELRELRAALRTMQAAAVPEAPVKPPSPVPAVTSASTDALPAVEPEPARPEPPSQAGAPEGRWFVPAEPEPARLVPPSPPLVAEMPQAVSQFTVLEQPSEVPEPPRLRPEPPLAPPVERTVEPPPAGPAINWEQFMGAKLFAWLGGLALFLAVAFFVKYSFEHDLIPPQVRVALGFMVGAGLVVGGLKVSLEKYRITAQTLVASGIVSLYAVTFSCNSIYHFAFFGPGSTFLLMTLITAAAFVLAVRLNAQVVALLGILGGFLTPVLINTGHDNPAGLFGYLAILVVGLVAVALHRGWLYLVPLGAAGTVLMMVGWANRFYLPEKTETAMVVCLGFCALFLGAAEAARRLSRDTLLLSRTAIALPAVAFGFAWFFLGAPGVAAQTGLFFTFVLLTSLFVFVLAWREYLGGLILGAAGVSALIMARWAASTFAAGQAPVIVSVCLAFSAIYFLVYLAARRLERAAVPVLWAAVEMPVVALVFACFLASQAWMGGRPALLFTLIFVSDGLLLALAWLDERLPNLHWAAGLATFALLAIWTDLHLTDALLPWALAASLLFAALHAAFPLLLERHRPASAPSWWNQLFPPLALLLMLFPIYKFETVSLLVWPAILLVDTHRDWRGPPERLARRRGRGAGAHAAGDRPVHLSGARIIRV